MNNYYADLHIHLGASSTGKPVKITASRKLIFSAVIDECLNRKGIDIAGIVDCAAPSVISDIEKLISKGELYELPDGGFLHKDKLLVILASEIEASEKNGRVSHHIAYFPFFRQIKEFSRAMKGHIKNIELSSQSSGLTCSELSELISSCGGIHVPAHIFTPHKSIFGRVTSKLTDIFTPEQIESIPAMELGLSADTEIGDRLSELSAFSFLSSSDAHSLPKIAREYTVFNLERPSFKEITLALHNSEGRSIFANFGMDPRLGRYHRSYCKTCDLVDEKPDPTLKCPNCGRNDGDFTLGVYDRVSCIADREQSLSPDFRPPYYYQIPLEFVKGLSANMISHLIEVFGSEMAVLHTVSKQELLTVVKPTVANGIIKAREGKLALASGGGGKYGAVASEKSGQLSFKF